jgi:hypothetical protein
MEPMAMVMAAMCQFQGPADDLSALMRHTQRLTADERVECGKHTVVDMQRSYDKISAAAAKAHDADFRKCLTTSALEIRAVLAPTDAAVAVLSESLRIDNAARANRAWREVLVGVSTLKSRRRACDSGGFHIQLSHLSDPSALDADDLTELGFDDSDIGWDPT